MRGIGLGKVRAWGLGSLLLAAACGGGEPAVPEARLGDGDDIIRFPVRADGSVDTSSVAAMSFGASLHDFGTVSEGALVRHRFGFRNTGAEPLVITRASSTCGCTVPEYPERPVAPGDTGSVLVVFDTEGKAGPQRKPVTLTANTYPNETTVEVRGVVEAQPAN